MGVGVGVFVGVDVNVTVGDGVITVAVGPSIKPMKSGMPQAMIAIKTMIHSIRIIQLVFLSIFLSLQ